MEDVTGAGVVRVGVAKLGRVDGRVGVGVTFLGNHSESNIG